MGIGTKLKVAMQDWVIAQMSKKANKYVVPISPLQSWEEIWSHAPGEYSWVQMERLPWQPLDTPSGGVRVLLTISQVTEAPGDTKVIKLRYTDGSAMLREYIGEVSDAESKQGRLVPIATATPPEERALPLATGLVACTVGNLGVSAQNTYRKNQFGEVTVTAYYQRSGGSDGIGNGSVVCTLPPGYRPAVPIEREASAFYDGSMHSAAGVVVGTDGNVALYLTVNVPYAQAMFEFSFVAATTAPNA